MNEQDARPRLLVEFANREALELEHAAHLCHGVVVTRTSQHLQSKEECVVVLVNQATGEELELDARFSLWALDGRAVCTLVATEENDLQGQLREFVSGTSPKTTPNAEAVAYLHHEEEEEAPAAEAEGEEGEGPSDIPANVYQRLRALPLHEVYKVARNGHLTERIALERIYGKTVWEPLLQNQNLTPPEVARIARMGNLPKPLIEVIVTHPGWINHSMVRRALLSNPRLEGQALMKTLRATPKPELKLLPTQAAYPYKVREAAKRLIT